MKVTILITTVLCSLMSLSSCKSTQETTKETVMSTNSATKKEVLMKEGYTSGTIVHSEEEGDCEWTIKLDDGRYYESMSMEDEFKKNDLKVFFKFVPQRRMSKCTKANPIEITEMIKE